MTYRKSLAEIMTGGMKQRYPGDESIYKQVNRNIILELLRLEGVIVEETTPIQQLLITVEEAAKILSLSRTIVYELINREGLPVHRFNSAVRISPTELQAWLNERKTT